MTAMSYDDIFNQTWEEVPEPQLLPDGGWLLTGANVSFIASQDADKSSKVLFNYKAKSPVSVDEDQLEELGDYDITTNDLSYPIYIENAASWTAVRKHLEKHGIELTGPLFDSNKKLSFAKAFRGSEVIAQLGARTYTNSEGESITQNSVNKFQAVEA